MSVPDLEPGSSTNIERRKLAAPVILLLLLLAPAVSAAKGAQAVDLRLGAYVHYHSSPEHKGPPILGAVELERPHNQFMGLALFNNSFGQFSQFVYYGWTFPLTWIHEGVHFKLPIGLIHGYRGEHKDDIPLNQLGVAPAVLPTLGYSRGHWDADVVMLGTAALLFTVGYRFDY